VVWKQPLTRQRYLIGRLWRDRAGYHFRYEHDLPRSVKDALEAGFRLLDEFPQLDGQWDSPRLFATFRRRLPPAWRLRDLRQIDLSPERAMEYFRLTGARLSTDTLEFLEPIQEEEATGEFTVRFPIAGWRYYQGDRVVHELTRGARLRLKLETDNPFDPSAIQILSPSGVLLRYVPAIYAWYIDDCVAAQDYEAVVDHIGPREDPQVRVIVRLRGSLAEAPPVRLIPAGLERYAALLR